MTAFTVKIIDRQLAAVVRAEVPMAGLRSVFDRGFGEVMRVARGARRRHRRAAVRVLPPDAGRHRGGGGRLPGVRPPSLPEGEVAAFELPGGRVVTGIHVGSYESLEATYRQLTEWAAAEGHSLAAHMWESYLTDPRAEPEPRHVADHDHVAARVTCPGAGHRFVPPGRGATPRGSLDHAQRRGDVGST